MSGFEQQISSKEEISISNPTQEITPEYSAIPKTRKYFILILVSLVGFLGPLSGNIYLPLLPLLAKEFNVSTSTINGTVSCFMVVFAIFPIFWSSISDYRGRKFLLLIALFIYIVSNILLAALPKHIAILYVFRFFQAIGVSTLSVGMGVIADLFEIKVRGKAVSYFLLGPQLGPVLGPILSIIGVKNRWRWIFGFLAFFGAFLLLLILFFLPETLRCMVGNGSYLKNDKTWLILPSFKKLQLIEKNNPKFPKPPKPTLKNYVTVFKQRNVILCTITGSLTFATFYGILTTFSIILKKRYNYTSWKVCIAYLCPGISIIVSSLTIGHLTDYIRKYCLQNNKQYIPEYRFIFQLFGSLVLACGVIGYGWCIEKRKHVISIFVLVSISSIGSTIILNCNTTYLLESSTKQPATFVSIGNCGRNVGAAICSAIINPLINRMGEGWCFTGLGFVCLFSFLLTLLHIFLGLKAACNNNIS